MPIAFESPWEPVFHNAYAFYFGMVLGFVVLLTGTFVADRIGTYLFHRGYAKPFYFHGHRIHHVCIYVIAPLAYLLLSTLLILGYVLPIWTDMYLRFGSLIGVIAICMCVDFAGDRLLPRISKDILHHHEWIYALIFIYIIQFVVEVRI